mmetsp:Transcript_17522/g.50885  ORF Transcript_17522/g.50885 Transcript_17522/m.50885 type:complete len:543 (+) Transcript_17522:496-2124(+)
MLVLPRSIRMLVERLRCECARPQVRLHPRLHEVVIHLAHRAWRRADPAPVGARGESRPAGIAVDAKQIVDLVGHELRVTRRHAQCLLQERAQALIFVSNSVRVGGRHVRDNGGHESFTERHESLGRLGETKHVPGEGGGGPVVLIRQRGGARIRLPTFSILSSQRAGIVHIVVLVVVVLVVVVVVFHAVRRNPAGSPSIEGLVRALLRARELRRLVTHGFKGDFNLAFGHDARCGYLLAPHLHVEEFIGELGHGHALRLAQSLEHSRVKLRLRRGGDPTVEEEDCSHVHARLQRIQDGRVGAEGGSRHGGKEEVDSAGVAAAHREVQGRHAVVVLGVEPDAQVEEEPQLVHITVRRGVPELLASVSFIERGRAPRQGAGHRQIALGESDVQRSVAPPIAGVHVCSVEEKVVGDSKVAFKGGNVQNITPVVVRPVERHAADAEHVHIRDVLAQDGVVQAIHLIVDLENGAALDEHLAQLDVTLLYGVANRPGAVSVPSVDVGVHVEQQRDDGHKARGGGEVQRGVPVVVYGVDVVPAGDHVAD